MTGLGDLVRDATLPFPCTLRMAARRLLAATAIVYAGCILAALLLGLGLALATKGP